MGGGGRWGGGGGPREDLGGINFELEETNRVSKLHIRWAFVVNKELYILSPF